MYVYNKFTKNSMVISIPSILRADFCLSVSKKPRNPFCLTIITGEEPQGGYGRNAALYDELCRY